ncbi:MAG: hypothetical protein M1817_003701 [Caeruleum heppii]|nr:MAG: hypothetical protein M1817_003701 [Caeruleum heppii]
MPPTNNDDQFKFLISCIRHANNSKVNFAAVADECGVISKGAAAKRYERMMKAHGITPSGSASRGVPSAAPSKRETAAAAKKRKLGDDDGVEDNDEVTPKVKKESKEISPGGVRIKQEATAWLDDDDNGLAGNGTGYGNFHGWEGAAVSNGTEGQFGDQPAGGSASELNPDQ